MERRMIEGSTEWLADVLPKYDALTSLVSSIMASLMQAQKIDYLALSSRVKSLESISKKIQRKNYSDPKSQLTDLGGVRVIVFFESDLQRVAEIIKGAFSVDAQNSSDKVKKMSVDQIGYRSLHFVCDMGAERCKLPEYKNLAGLKFEFQVRTVLQHAWAELAHDRNYKFSGKLPEEAERKLYLYAGMLELADKGLNELSREMDQYISQVAHEIERGEFFGELNSVSLPGFVAAWASKHKVVLKNYETKDGFQDLLDELAAFGIRDVSDLEKIVPHDYHKYCDGSRAIYGVVRDWMLAYDWRRFVRDVSFDWFYQYPEDSPIWYYLAEDERASFCQAFHWGGND